MRAMKIGLVAATIFMGAIFMLAACKRDEVVSYNVTPQDTPLPVVQASEPASHEQASEPESKARLISWQLPSGWTEKQTTSNIRVGSFAVPGKDGLDAEVSVVALPGQAGGEFANLNMWRSQIDLPPVAETDASKYIERIDASGQKMAVVDMVAEKNLIHDKYKPRIVAAICPRKDATWFFKLMGEDQIVGAAKPSFFQFLNSLTFHDAE